MKGESMSDKCGRCRELLINPAMYCNPCYDKLVKCGEIKVLKENERAHSIMHTGKGGKEIWNIKERL